MTEPSNIVPFPQLGSAEWIADYHQVCLIKRNDATIDAYLRILRQFTEWVANRPGHSKQFQPEYLTTAVVEGYLSQLKERGYSLIPIREPMCNFELASAARLVVRKLYV